MTEHHATERTPEFDLVHAKLLRFFPELVAELGGHPARLLQQVGLDPGTLTSGDPRLRYREWINLLERAASELHCTDFGMRLARQQSGGKAFGPIGLVMQHSPTLGDALEYVAGHVQAHSLAAGIRLEHDCDARRWFVGHEILLDRLPNRRQAIEQALLLGHLNAIESTGGRARAREVHFRHQPLSSRSTYRAFFGCPIRFDAPADGLVFSEEDLQCPIVRRDEHLYEVATSFIDSRFAHLRQPMHAQVRALLVRLIETGDCNNERICEALRLHPRTLHRRLQAEGTSFEAVKDDLRRDLALRYLQETDHPLSFIAGKLGYAEQSVLTRSCMRWFASAPSALRSRAA